MAAFFRAHREFFRRRRQPRHDPAAGETAIGFDDDAVISGGVLNTGTIRAAQTGIVAITVSTFAGGITNIGTLSAGAVGIRLGSATIPQQYTVSSFTGDIVNSGTITAKTGITLIDSTMLGAIVDSGNLLAPATASSSTARAN